MSQFQILLSLFSMLSMLQKSFWSAACLYFIPWLIRGGYIYYTVLLYFCITVLLLHFHISVLSSDLQLMFVLFSPLAKFVVEVFPTKKASKSQQDLHLFSPKCVSFPLHLQKFH